MKIDASVKKVEDLKEYFFIVPDYQREYVWESEKNVSRFLQDLNDEFNPNTCEQSNYFIGSIIIVKRKDSQYDIIDGQQRLTTIIIGLCAIRDILGKMKFDTNDDESPKETKDELLKIVRDILYKYSIQQGKKSPRLVLQYEESKDYLLNLIEERDYSDTRTRSIKRMESAYQTILTFLQQLESNEALTLINFVRYFLVNVEMVIIEPDDLGSALKIFETINERGVGLNAMDLLKNLLFSKAGESDFKRIKDIWKLIVENLENCGESEKPLRFLRYFLIARHHDGIIREEDIYQWIISKEGKNRLKYETHPVEFAKEIFSISEKYRTFINATVAWHADPEYPSVTGIGYLSKKNSRQHIILLLAIDDALGKEAINLLAKNIESLSFYYATLNILTKYYEIIFAVWATKIRALRTREELIKFIKVDIGAEILKHQTTFDGSFINKSQWDIQPQYRIKYIFGKVEEYIRIGVNFPQSNFMFYQDQQIEHILPQTGTNIPEEKYPEEYDYRIAVNRIGNLTLLEQPINGSINYANDISTGDWFTVKRNAYKNSHILLTSTIPANTIGNDTAYNRFVSVNLLHFDDWNREKINERQQMLKKLMLKTWPLIVE